MLIPIVSELKKSEKLFKRWRHEQKFEIAQKLYNSNNRVQSVLKNKPTLIPPEFEADSLKLLAHYGSWIERYNNLLTEYESKKSHTPFPETKFKVAARGYPFPSEAADHFIKKLLVLHPIIRLKGFELNQ